MTRKGELTRIFKHFSFSAETACKNPYPHSAAGEESLLFFSSQKKRDLSAFDLRMKGKD